MARLWQCGKLLMARWIMRGWISQHGISWVSLMWGWLGQLWQWRGGHMTHTWTHDHSGHWPMLSGHGAWPSHYTGSHASTGHWSQGARSITGHRSHRTQYTDLCWAVTLSLARCSPNHWSISTPAPMAVSEWACSLWLRWLQLLGCLYNCISPTISNPRKPHFNNHPSTLKLVTATPFAINLFFSIVNKENCYV